MLPVIRRLATARPFLSVARCYSDHGHHMTLKEVCEDRGALMDLLPKPEGDYNTKYKEKCRKYNMHILISSILVAVTSYQMYTMYEKNVPKWILPENYNIYEEMKRKEEEADEEADEE